MVLNPTQLQTLVLKFDNADVWTQVCNNIDWRNIDVNSFLEELNADASLRLVLTKIAIYVGEQNTGYDKLCEDINARGSVQAALKNRIDRMKWIYQRVYSDVTLTPTEKRYRRQKLWDYIREDRNKWAL